MTLLGVGLLVRGSDERIGNLLMGAASALSAVGGALYCLGCSKYWLRFVRKYESFGKAAKELLKIHWTKLLALLLTVLVMVVISSAFRQIERYHRQREDYERKLGEPEGQPIKPARQACE